MDAVRSTPYTPQTTFPTGNVSQAKPPAATVTIEKTTESSDKATALDQLKKYKDGLGDVKPKSGQGKVSDQDFPVEAFRMVPPNPTEPPVLIIGGMGPLAGAQAMEAALEKFGDTREIALLQLCCTPDRTAALRADAQTPNHKKSSEHEKVDAALAEGFAVAQGLLTTTHLGKGHMVVACNTAHNFVPAAFEKFEASASGGANVQSDSLVNCVVNRLKDEKRPVLLLGTSGTRDTKLYTAPLEKVGVDCKNLEGDGKNDGQSMHTLMNAIYKGVKAFDSNTALKEGEKLFTNLWENKKIPEKDCVILSACTEVPEIMNLLKEKGSEATKEKLKTFEIVDPMEVTLNHIQNAGAERAQKPGGAHTTSLNPANKV